MSSLEKWGQNELFGDEIDNLSLTNPLTGEVLKTNDELFIYPAKHFVTPENRMKAAVEGIKKELDERLDVFKKEGKLLELGIEPRTSAVLRPRHNQLDHPSKCFVPVKSFLAYLIQIIMERNNPLHEVYIWYIHNVLFIFQQPGTCYQVPCTSYLVILEYQVPGTTGIHTSQLTRDHVPDTCTQTVYPVSPCMTTGSSL